MDTSILILNMGTREPRIDAGHEGKSFHAASDEKKLTGWWKATLNLPEPDFSFERVTQWLWDNKGAGKYTYTFPVSEAAVDYVRSHRGTLTNVFLFGTTRQTSSSPWDADVSICAAKLFGWHLQNKYDWGHQPCPQITIFKLPNRVHQYTAASELVKAKLSCMPEPEENVKVWFCHSAGLPAVNSALTVQLYRQYRQELRLFQMQEPEERALERGELSSPLKGGPAEDLQSIFIRDVVNKHLERYDFGGALIAVNDALDRHKASGLRERLQQGFDRMSLWIERAPVRVPGKGELQLTTPQQRQDAWQQLYMAKEKVRVLRRLGEGERSDEARMDEYAAAVQLAGDTLARCADLAVALTRPEKGAGPINSANRTAFRAYNCVADKSCVAEWFCGAQNLFVTLEPFLKIRNEVTHGFAPMSEADFEACMHLVFPDLAVRAATDWWSWYMNELSRLIDALRQPEWSPKYGQSLDDLKLEICNLVEQLTP